MFFMFLGSLPGEIGRLQDPPATILFVDTPRGVRVIGDDARDLTATHQDAAIQSLYDAMESGLSKALGPRWWRHMSSLTGIDERSFRRDRFERYLLPGPVLTGIRDLVATGDDAPVVGAGLLGRLATEKALGEVGREPVDAEIDRALALARPHFTHLISGPETSA